MPHNLWLISLSLLVFDHETLVKMKVNCQRQLDRILPILHFIMMRTQISQALKYLGIMGFQNSVSSQNGPDTQNCLFIYSIGLSLNFCQYVIQMLYKYYWIKL